MTRTDLINTAFLASAAGWENVDGNFLVSLLIVITAAASLATMVLGWFRKNPPDTEKFRHSDECERRCAINVAEHEKIEEKLERAISELRHAVEDLDKKDEERSLKLHNRINEMLGAVSRIQGKLDK